jgi:ABC-type uncharacterized transport system ATPase subunit
MLVTARSLTKVYGAPPGFTAVDGIDFEVRPGEGFGFLGPNGAASSFARSADPIVHRLAESVGRGF